MDTCDVVIVGGGPAGSTCAAVLCQAGLDVLIIDKAVFPRDKVCGGWITVQVAEELGLDVEAYAHDRLIQPLTGFVTGIIGGPPVETHFGQPVSYGIRRREFDHYLLARCGARLRLGEPVKKIVRFGDRWIIDDVVSAPVVIGAGGHWCPVARHLGARPGRREGAVAAREIEFTMNARQRAECRVDAGTPELYFCSDLAGYGWCFRKGDVINVGLGRLDNHGLSEHAAEFCDMLQRQRRISRDFPGKLPGHAYLLYTDSTRKLSGDGMLIIGDAAGLAYAQSGEGIRPAVESAILAANVIIEAAGDYSDQNLASYAERLAARLGVRGERNLADRLVPGSVRRALAGYLMTTHWFNRHVVLNRWFFHADDAPLVSGLASPS